MELRPELAAEKRAVNDRLNPFPLTPSLSLRERENHSARLEGPNTSGRSVVQVLVKLPWRRPSMRGIEASIPER